jgi:hypothetical protein
LEQLDLALRERSRVRLWRNATENAVIGSAQLSTKTTGIGGEQRNYEGSKRVVGASDTYS